MTGFKTNTIIHEAKDLSKYGKDFQMKLVALLIKDRGFCFSIMPIIKSVYISDIYLRTIFDCIKAYMETYGPPPTIENIKIVLQAKGERIATYSKILTEIENIDLQDRDFVIDNTQAFCFTKHALVEHEKIVIALKQGDFEEAKKLSIQSFQHSGLDSARVFDVKQDFKKIYEHDTMRCPVPSMFETFNSNSKGGPGAGDLCIVVAPSNFGKCFAPGTKVRMYDYSLKNIEDIKNGDLVLGWDGKKRTVEGVTTGFEEMFEIQQKNGMNYTVNKSHILALKRLKHKIFEYKDKKEYINIEVHDYLKKTKNWKNNVRGYKSSLEFKDKDITIDPYYLGLWLGDGSKRNTTITNVDTEIIDYLKNYAVTEKLTWSHHGEYGNAIVTTKGTKNLLKEKLKSFDLISNKHIPNNYLFSSRNTRLKLLAGLIDSDGCLDKIAGTNFEIVQKDKSLAWDIYVLVSSLGFKTRFKECDTTFNGHPYKHYSITISGDTNSIPTILPRKKAKARTKKYDSLNTEINVVAKGMGQYFGFSIEEDDKRFLLEDFTVVHNTNFLAAIARHAAVNDKNVVYFSYEESAEAVTEKFLSGLIDHNRSELKYAKNEAEDRLLKNPLGNVKIIEDKASKATIASLKTHMQHLKSFGFFADLICVDGLNQLKLPQGVRAKDDNEKFEILTEDLREFLKEEQVPGYACWQSNRCVQVNTKVIIENKGEIEIKDVEEGDMILTADGFKKILKKYPVEKQPVYKIKLKNGKTITCSAKHEFPVGNGELKSIETGLSIGDKLITKNT